MNDDESDEEAQRAVFPRKRECRAEREAERERFEDRGLDKVAMPRPVAGDDRVGERLRFSHEKMVNLDELLDATREPDEQRHAERRPDDPSEHKAWCHRPEFRPTIHTDQSAKRDVNEERVFFRDDEHGQRSGESGEPAPMIGAL